VTGRTVTAVTTTPLDSEPQPPADATHVSDWELYDDQGVFRYHSTDCGHGVALSGFQSFDGTDRQKWITVQVLAIRDTAMATASSHRPFRAQSRHRCYFPYAESSGAVDVTRYTQPCLPKSAVPPWRRA